MGDCTLRSDESHAGSREAGDTCVKSRFAQSKSSAGPFMGYDSVFFLFLIIFIGFLNSNDRVQQR